MLLLQCSHCCGPILTLLPALPSPCSRSSLGFRLRLWLTYSPCQTMFIRQESIVMKLHFNCHYECTIWIFYQVWFLRHAYCRYFIYCKHPFLFFLFVSLGPYLSMGIVVEQTWFWWTALWETYIIFCHLFTNESGDSILGCNPCLLEWGSLDRIDLLIDSYWLFWPCLAVLCLVAKFLVR